MDSSSSVRPAGRRDRQKRSRERRIVRTAERLFARHGFASTAMEQVAEGAKLAVGTIYNYFPTKTDLLLAIIGRETSAMLKRGQSILASPPREPVEAVTALTDLFVEDLIAGDRRLWRELVAGAITQPTTIGSRMFEGDAQLVALLAELIRRFAADGTFQARIDAPRAATVVYGVCFCWTMAYLLNDDLTATSVREEIHRGIELALNGMMTREPQLARDGGKGK